VRYWWVNQNQTHHHEISGGYLWCPTRKKNKQRNPYYEFMREVAPGDLILSFFGQEISALGIARSFCYEFPKPIEFGASGEGWDIPGWRVDVSYQLLSNRIRPSAHIEILRDLLPKKYSPLRANGHGLQNIYLTEISPALFETLVRQIGPEASQVADPGTSGRTGGTITESQSRVEEWENRIETAIRADQSIDETDRVSLVTARRGQGLFRKNVMRIERACRVTKVNRLEHLIASHIKPWRDGNNSERLDGENGLLLTPTVDHLFDNGFISFEDMGRIIVSRVADPISLARMLGRVEDQNVGPFTEGQRKFLEYHREKVLRQSNVNRS